MVLGLKTKQLGLTVNYFSTVRNLAGIFSKPLQKPTQGTLVSMLMTWAFGLSLAQDFWRLWTTSVKVPSIWGMRKLRYLSTRFQEALPEVCSESINHLACPKFNQRNPQEENRSYLNKRPLVHTKWKVPRGYGQSTSLTCGNELRKKRIAWMLIICSSAFLGFSRFEDS